MAFKNFIKLRGKAYNIGGGLSNSLSVIELLNLLQKKLDIKLNFYKINKRAFDQKIFISDNKKIYKDLKWKPLVSYKKGINQMIKWIKLSKIYKNV